MFRVPFIRAPMCSFRDWLVVTTATALYRTGLADAINPENARRHLGAALSQRSRVALSYMEAAAKLDTFNAESKYWRERLQQEFHDRMTRTRDMVSASIQIGLGIVVGVLVFSVYLPLFALGQIL